ncbi:MAG: hypothetical protein RL701_4014 [Pseudomonadota bacterium]
MLFEHSPTPFQILGADGHSLVCNQAFRDLLGSEPPPEYNVFEDDIVARLGFSGLIRRAFAGETVRVPAQWYDARELTNLLVRPEGRRVAIEVTLLPLCAQDGRVSHVAVCAKDVTAQEELRSERAQIAATMNSIGDAVIATDAAGRVEHLNRVAEELTGWPLVEARGRALTDVFHVAQPAPRDPAGFGAVERPSDLPPAELRLISRTGSEYPIRQSRAPIRDSDGTVRGSVLVFHDNTDDTKAEHALRESRRRVLRAERVAGLGFWDWDLQSARFVVSEEAYRICGVPGRAGREQRDAVDSPLWLRRVIHPEDIERIEAALHRVLLSVGAEVSGENVAAQLCAAAEQEFDLDVRVLWPDGQVHWVNTAAEVVRDREGKPAALLGTLFDISDRKRTEEVLRASEQRLRLLHELADATRALTDPAAIVSTSLAVLVEHMHVTQAVFVGVTPQSQGFSAAHGGGSNLECFAATGSEALSWYGPAAKQQLAGGHSVVFRNVPDELSDGRASLALCARGVAALICCPVLRDGLPVAVLAVHHRWRRAWSDSEITVLREVLERTFALVEQRDAETKLRQGEALLRIASQTAHIGGWSVDLTSPELRVACSDEVLALHELRPGTRPLLADVLERCAPEFRGVLRSRLHDCMRDGTPCDLELLMQTTTGKPIWMRAIGRAERNLQGAVVRVHGALQDITERRQLEEQLRQAQKMDAVGRLAGGVAHDFNNLLSVILSYAAMIVQTLASDDPLRADIEEISKAGQRASALTQQLLAFSRQQVLQPRVVDLNAVLSNLEKMLQRVLGADISLSLLAGASLGTTLADPNQLEQVIVNLAVNARDAMPSGGHLVIETTNIDVDAATVPLQHGVPVGRYVMLTVADTGVGMATSLVSRIFEPFFTTKEQGKGTGLGLSTVHGIVTQSGGHVAVHSELGVGTAFKVYLPRLDPTQATQELSVVSEAAAVSAPTTHSYALSGSETILLVEDEEQIRGIMRAILRRSGYNVLEAQNGGEAFLICEQYAGPIHLLVADVVMPRMSGRELANRVTRMRPDMRVLYVSGYAENAPIQPRFVDNGSGKLSAAELLHKPITPEALARKVRETLDRDTNAEADCAIGA